MKKALLVLLCLNLFLFVSAGEFGGKLVLEKLILKKNRNTHSYTLETWNNNGKLASYTCTIDIPKHFVLGLKKRTNAEIEIFHTSNKKIMLGKIYFEGLVNTYGWQCYGVYGHKKTQLIYKTTGSLPFNKSRLEAFIKQCPIKQFPSSNKAK